MPISDVGTPTLVEHGHAHAPYQDGLAAQTGGPPPHPSPSTQTPNDRLNRHHLEALGLGLSLSSFDSSGSVRVVEAAPLLAVLELGADSGGRKKKSAKHP